MTQSDIDALADSIFRAVSGYVDARNKAAEARAAALVDARIKSLPAPMPGKDGAPGERGADGIGRDGQDGQAGRDGRDAIDGLADIEADYDGERNFKFVFVRSTGVRQEMQFKAPIQIYRGVYQERAYERGDNVTKNGCQWTCIKDTTTAPPSPDWVQSTKAGRDGRDK